MDAVSREVQLSLSIGLALVAAIGLGDAPARRAIRSGRAWWKPTWCGSRHRPPAASSSWRWPEGSRCSRVRRSSASRPPRTPPCWPRPWRASRSRRPRPRTLPPAAGRRSWTSSQAGATRPGARRAGRQRTAAEARTRACRTGLCERHAARLPARRARPERRAGSRTAGAAEGGTAWAAVKRPARRRSRRSRPHVRRPGRWRRALRTRRSRRLLWRWSRTRCIASASGSWLEAPSSPSCRLPR